MARLVLVPLDRAEVAPLPVSPRLRSQIMYFATAAGPPTGEDEYRFDAAEVAQWLEDGVIELVSPLDTANMTEVELSEEQEAVLGWLMKHKISHVKVAEQ